MILVLIGEAASGKTTVAKILEEDYGFHRVVTHTTRPMRVGEIADFDYHYVSQEDFNQMNQKGEFLETAAHGAWSYGTHEDEVIPYIGANSPNCLVILNPVGFRTFKKAVKGDILSVYIDVGMRDRFIKMLERQDDIHETYRRINYDNGQFNGVKDEVDIVINNDGYRLTPKDMAERIYNAVQDLHSREDGWS